MPFEVNVRGVLDFVPELRLDENNPAHAATVTTFLNVIDPQVSSVLGARLRALRDLEAAGVAEATTVIVAAEKAAASLVALGAASLLQDSRYPELAANRNTDQAWGSALWQRYTDALEQLAASLDADLERLGADTIVDELAVEVPAVSAPAPFFRDGMKF